MTKKARFVLLTLVLTLGIFVTARGVYAYPSYLTDYNNTFGTSVSCSLCHVNSPPDKTLTPTGTTFKNSGNNVCSIAPALIGKCAPAPVISSFAATPGSITSGQSSTLSWALSGGAPTTLGIDNGVGSVFGSSSKAVTPGATTTYTLTASNSAASVTKSVIVTVTAESPTPPSTGTISMPDMAIWMGKWFKITIKNAGYYVGASSNGNPAIRNVATSDDNEVQEISSDFNSVAGYLKFWSSDTNQNILQADLYEPDGNGGWITEPLSFHYIGGSDLDFLCWSQVTGDFSLGLTARIHGNDRNGVLRSASFKTLGGYYFEIDNTLTPPEYWAGGFSMNGTLIQESKVPVPSDVQVH